VDDLVVLQTVSSPTEAAVVLGVLSEAGIDSYDRPTNFAAGAADGLTVLGPRDIVVRAEDAEAARATLAERLSL
jgi:hypothetical protein